MGYAKGTFGAPTATPLPGKEEIAPRLVSAMYRGAIIVGADGKRFVDESISYKAIGDRCNGLADKAHFALRQEWLVFDRLTVRPGCIFAGHDGDYAGKFLRFFGMNTFDLCVGLRAEEGFSMEHVREHEIVAIDRFAGQLFRCVYALDRLPYDG